MPGYEGHYDVLVYCGAQMRRYLLPFVMDDRYTLYAPTAATALKKDLRINLTAKGGKWRIAEGDYALEPDKEVTLTAQDVSIRIGMRTLNQEIINYRKYRIDQHSTVSISKQDGKVCVMDSPSDSNLAVITWSGKEATITPQQTPTIFLNGTALTQRHKLRALDSLYIGEVNLVYLGAALAIDHAKIVQCNLPPCKMASTKKMAENPLGLSKSVEFQRSTQVRHVLIPEQETIDVPPPPKPHRPVPFWLQAGASLSMFFVMAASLLVRVTMGASSQVLIVVSTFSLFGSVAGMVLFPKLMRDYQARKAKEEERERYEAYHDYLKAKEKELEGHLEKDKIILDKRYLPASDALQVARTLKRVLWGRAPVYQEFLDIRIGTGDRPALHSAQMAKEGFVIIKDPCRVDAEKIIANYQYISNAPLSVELMKDPVVGIYGHRNTCLALLHSMLIQIVALHSYDDVKIILLYDAESDFIRFARWLPHMWNRERNFRYIARAKNEVDNIFEHLKPLFDEREEKKEKQKSQEEVYVPHYIVVSLSSTLLKNEMLHQRFLSNYDDLSGMGISFLVVDKNLSGMPILSNTLIECKNAQEAYIGKNDGKTKGMRFFVPDILHAEDWRHESHSTKYWWSPPTDWPSLARHMYRVKTMDTSENSLLPQSLSFFGMYEAKSPEDLAIARRWRQNDNARHIKAPVGVSASGIFNIDIHEKGHGPHGLIAGTTGSGKSEFIQSLLLSLCVNYSPNDISFIIIDYKGGSTANIFSSLPHLAGSITNLGGNQIQRSLLSIKSEIKKRQRLLAQCSDVSVNDIDKYNDLRKKDTTLPAMPHLILIADEFAELKKEQSVFMDEIISASRIGRSLGIHLLLATQKPSGVVNEQILSNTRFRICLKVADKNDSNEMLKKPDAADIIQVGRAYVQVGNNEIYQQIQTGYSGAPFRVGENAGKELGEIFYLQHNGQINPGLSAREALGLNETAPEKTVTQLKAVVEYIASLSQTGFKPYRLWLDPLPECLPMETLIRREDFPRNTVSPHYRWMAPTIGLIDDVRRQDQPLLSINFADDGHLALYGVKGSGKTTFLQTLICALALQYTPNDVHLYIIDYDIGTFIRYKDQLPHIGGVILPDDDQRLKSLFHHLETQKSERKKRLSDSGAANIKQYNAGNKDKLPAILILIHNFEAFAEERDLFKDKVRELIRDSDKAGIFFVLTGSSRAALPSNIHRYIKSFLCLQMIEPFDYKNILNIKEDLKPEPVSGRGLIKIRDHAMEFQTAITVQKDEDGKMDDRWIMARFSEIKSAWKGNPAHRLETIPNPYLFKPSLASETYRHILSGDRLPLGYDRDTNTMISLPVRDIEVYPIVGGHRTGKTNLLKCLLELCGAVRNTKRYIFDANEKRMQMTASTLGLSETYANDSAGMDALGTELRKIGISRGQLWLQHKAQDFEPIIIFIDDIVNFYSVSGKDTIETIGGLMSKGTKYGIYFFVTCGKIDSLKGQTTIYDTLFDYNNGILLGGNYDMFPYFKTAVAHGKERSNVFPAGFGYIFSKGKYAVIQTPEHDHRSR